ncbi:MAG: efflux RND transporter periplasmic adaptor subunit [Bacteroidales bacterium]|nr:efflux RND transporter periplasmic adaptor subunit [Bacteroidales bacterium]
MTKRTLLAILTICSLLACACKEGAKTAPKEDSLYETLEICLGDRTLTTGYSAAISGVQTVEIRPQVSGMITDILIEEGESVRKGQVLFVIDQTPYKAAYEIAIANVKSAEAALSTARLIYESNKNLFEQDVVSEFDLMTAQNDLTEAEARLALCKAEEVNASNNLSYTEVRSPVNGVASMIPYRVGALVNSSITQPLVTVSDDSRVYAYFSMAENQMLDMVQQYGSLNNAIKQMPEVELIMSNGEKYEHTGKINAISGTISESTGSVSLRAVFNNRNHLLRNGGSGTIIIPVTVKDRIVIPQSATYELQDRVFVYKVVNGKASSTEIRISPQNNGTEYIVEDGLQVGDIIVAEGAGLIKEGTVIRSKNQKVTEPSDTLKTEEGLE